MRDFGGGEERCARIRTSRDAGSAADAGGGVHGAVGGFLWNQNVVAVGSGARGGRDIAAGGDDAVECGTVDDEVAEDGEGFGAPRFEVQLVAVVEVAEGELAYGGFRERAVGDAVDHEAAGTADAFATIVLEGDGVFAFENQIFVQHVEGFEHRHVGVEPRLWVADHAAGLGSRRLAPDVKG